MVWATPPDRLQTTKTPTASSATSLTTASMAMAVITPWWRSFASRLRVPKRIAKSASPAATQNTLEPSEYPVLPGSALAKVAKEKVTDCSCSAM